MSKSVHDMLSKASLGEIANWLEGTGWSIDRKEGWVGIMPPGGDTNWLHGHPNRKLSYIELEGLKAHHKMIEAAWLTLGRIGDRLLIHDVIVELEALKESLSGKGDRAKVKTILLRIGA